MGVNSKLFAMDRQLLNVTLEQLGEYSQRQILAVMREEADNIAFQAKQNAPVDEGFLEDAIQVVEDREGINGRVRVSVQVDPDARDDRGESVYDYGVMLNALLAPFGSGAWNLGELSRAKDGGRGVVGGRFIERAVISRQAIIGRKINQIARKIFS
jgi:hypothetical protein